MSTTTTAGAAERSKSKKRRHPDSNWGSGFCRPLPYHLAMSPEGVILRTPLPGTLQPLASLRSRLRQAWQGRQMRPQVRLRIAFVCRRSVGQGLAAFRAHYRPCHQEAGDGKEHEGRNSSSPPRRGWGQRADRQARRPCRECEKDVHVGGPVVDVGVYRLGHYPAAHDALDTDPDRVSGPMRLKQRMCPDDVVIHWTPTAAGEILRPAPNRRPSVPTARGRLGFALSCTSTVRHTCITIFGSRPAAS